jgi:nucleoside-diphosphate-sugar epimerase
MKRVLICGSNGLFGQRLALMLSPQTEYEVLNTSRKRSFVFDDRLFDYTQLDITKKSDVKSLVSSFHPTTIINAAAAADVDWCEQHREDAWKINVVGVENLIEAARKVGARLIHISTDYIFDGTHGPYSEDDKPNPSATTESPSLPVRMPSASPGFRIQFSGQLFCTAMESGSGTISQPGSSRIFVHAAPSTVRMISSAIPRTSTILHSLL